MFPLTICRRRLEPVKPLSYPVDSLEALQRELEEIRGDREQIYQDRIRIKREMEQMYRDRRALTPGQ